MRRVSPSMIAREKLQRLLAGSADREANVVSALVETVTRLVVEELLEAEQADYLGGRGRYERRVEGQVGSRNGYEPGRIRTAEGPIEVAVPQVRGAAAPFRSSLMSFLDGNSEVLDRLVTEMYARGLSTRDVEDAFRDATGELLISRSKVSEITDRLWEDYQAFISRDLSELEDVPVRRRGIRGAAPARREAGTAGLLVHRLWSAGASTPTGVNTCCTGRRQQGVRGVLDRVLPQHARPRAADADHRHRRRRARTGQGDRGLFPRLDPDPVLVPPAGQHPRQAARRVGLGGDGAPVCGARRPDARRGPRRRGPADQHLRPSVPSCGCLLP